MVANKQGYYLTIMPLFLVLVIDAMGFGLVFPLIGSLILDSTSDLLHFETAKHAREIWYGISISSFFICMLIGSPFFGALSDRWGRKKVLLICLKGTALAYLVSYFGILSHSIILFIAGRAVAGFLAGSQSIAQAAIIDISPPENKTVNLAMITLASSLGWCIGPLVGGIFSSPNISNIFSPTTPFLVSAGLAFLNFAWLWYAFHETHQVKAETSLPLYRAFTLLIDAFRRPIVRFFALVFLAQQVAFGFYYQYVALVFIEDFKYTPLKLGAYNTFMGIVFMLSLLVIIRICLRFAGTKTITVWMLWLLSTALIANLIYTQESSYWMLLPPVIIAVGLSYACLISLFSDAVNENEQGWVMGVSEAVGSLGWIIGSGFVASISLFGINTIVVGICTAVALLALFLWQYKVPASKA